MYCGWPCATYPTEEERPQPRPPHFHLGQCCMGHPHITHGWKTRENTSNTHSAVQIMSEIESASMQVENLISTRASQGLSHFSVTSLCTRLLPLFLSLGSWDPERTGTRMWPFQEESVSWQQSSWRRRDYLQRQWNPVKAVSIMLNTLLYSWILPATEKAWQKKSCLVARCGHSEQTHPQAVAELSPLVSRSKGFLIFAISD